MVSSPETMLVLGGIRASHGPGPEILAGGIHAH